MKEKSSLFDSIRIKPAKAKKQAAAAKTSLNCEWKNCDKKGGFKAPKGRDREGQYHNFCQEHVREYNKTYNYFNGMDDSTVATYQKDSHTGHRPTWEMGVNSWTKEGERKPMPNADTADPAASIRKPKTIYNSASHRRRTPGEEAPKVRKLKRLEKQSLDTLKLGADATSKEIKSKYKQLVKIHHPDANGGDRSSEDQLREIIKAYNFLKSAGFTD